jgi:antirestriction protein ArdC
MRDIHQEVTDRIVAALETGVAPWVKPWKETKGGTMPHNAVTRRAYSGVNVLLLWIAAQEKGYAGSGWLTFKQAKELGGNVRKGEKATNIVFMKPLTFTETTEGGDTEEKSVLLARGYAVFNIEQCDGLPERIHSQKADNLVEVETDAAFNAWVAGTGASLRHGGNRACYSPSHDAITMPKPEQFRDLNSYKATLLHELTHWTGHKSRLDRNLRNRFGSQEYAAEELVAELGAAFLCAELQVDGQLQHAEYIASWLKVLKADKRAIFTAASAASKAANYLKEAAAVPQLQAA